MKLKNLINKMDDKNKVDISSFLLFEATGDNSEVLDSSTNTKFTKFSPEDDSDAMSCSYDESDRMITHDIDDDPSVGFLDQDLGFEGKSVDEHFHYLKCGKEEEDEGVVDQDLKPNKVSDKIIQPNKLADKPPESSIGCVESCVELMRRREQDKLFWKSCLES
ncbi:hypothetical protein LIER_18555 [Lithospermum erythrorhizon]|uniref:Uncharacterized protein n=1 Tax=Lithospermum erythrorhizon TaxID=34254 RepID=A0AAV3QH79_LITER